MEKNYKKDTITYKLLTFLTFYVDIYQFGNVHNY